MTAGAAEVREHMAHIRENGFVNYFGLQRFGISSVMTHVWCFGGRGMRAGMSGLKNREKASLRVCAGERKTISIVGTPSDHNDMQTIGIALLQEDWKRAAELILSPREDGTHTKTILIPLQCHFLQLQPRPRTR